ncbi:hypothetical protein E6P09_09685 [Haloferax mediterranei ATCC 33500]|uniref:Uncharacterized protein n=1 Tax=Haloferax mediterranei (strain ATCC 33500 / DSM 1411 / JCM 8866 / NBRC 14739 / NCIMB 2177 / R-4) TaxID=523841 RepID=I3R485_HALMT|nr:hypothetical protein [Haloferax mediterranei]AFK19045.1 hypothetical protein HFX_1334 [Haloferax mediterranei ATCC 33500]AHZ21596.1 hypothetical protein BM92_02520 [Haloferax mediterranei ATCC 33500]EMA03691.1 hypothetical protein C439_03840 [Haloferax mediterranei ATCC 33500]MDX5989137.1 hypothetical protein [Haloferax mediterranei ATCC 33500]QCQ75518.1 hypothetical protein E6P09_09685 [Haloferax mediterranei ATCC 33500]
MSNVESQRLGATLSDIDHVMGVTRSVRESESNAAERGRLKRALWNLNAAVDDIEDYLRGRSEREFVAEVSTKMGVDVDDLDVESEVVDGEVVHRARWSL